MKLRLIVLGVALACGLIAGLVLGLITPRPEPQRLLDVRAARARAGNERTVDTNQKVAIERENLRIDGEISRLRATIPGNEVAMLDLLDRYRRESAMWARVIAALREFVRKNDRDLANALQADAEREEYRRLVASPGREQ